MRVHLCGVRGSTPAPGMQYVRYGGHTSCVAIAPDDRARPTLLLDAGVGLQVAARLFDGEPFDGTILLSHLHWDHVTGLPFFSAGDHAAARISVVLPEQDSGEDAADVLGAIMRPPFFPVGPTQLRGGWSFDTLAAGERTIEGFSVLAREVPHKGGRTFGYRISDGHSTVTYIPDHCPTSLGPGPDGLGEYHEAALELARDTDVLIHDAQLFPEELASEGQYGHSVADYAIRLGEQAGARSVVLFHHRPGRTDDQLDELAARVRAISPSVSVGVEGAVIELLAPSRVA